MTPRLWLASVVAVVAALLAAPHRLTAADRLRFDHVSFSVPVPADAAAWYAKSLGAAPDDASGVTIGRIRLRFRKADHALPSAGTTIDHIAISFPDLASRIERWRADGLAPATAAGDVNGATTVWLTDPWGTRIEALDDRARPGFHHVHLATTDPDAAATWLKTMFGGDEATTRGLRVITFDDAWVALQRTARPPAPSVESVIDHVGFTTSNVDESVTTLRAAGVAIAIEPRTVGALRMAFVESPERTRIELVQR